MKVLVIQQKMIGDVLTSTIICQAIKESNSDIEIHYMIYPNCIPVVENNPYIDRIVVFDPMKYRGFLGLLTFGKILRTHHYHAVIDAYGKWESIIPAYLSNAKVKIGFKKWYTRFFYSDSVKPKQKISGSAVYHRMELVWKLFPNSKFIKIPKIFITKEERLSAASKIKSLKAKNVPLIMISVLGSENLKSLPPKKMAELLEFIIETRNVQLILNYMPDQGDELKNILDFCSADTIEKLNTDFYTKGLREFICVLDQCDALIGNEGGAVNMAKALGVKTFTLYSPWISKYSWNMLTDEENHIDVHLSDYIPEIYKNVHPKKLKKEALELYEKLELDLYKDELQKFIKSL